MHNKHMSIVATLLGAVLLGGCSNGTTGFTLFGGENPGTTPAKAAVETSAAAGGVASTDDSTRLAAIEEFLARTSDYQQSAADDATLIAARSLPSIDSNYDGAPFQQQRPPQGLPGAAPTVPDRGTMAQSDDQRAAMRTDLATANGQMSLPAAQPLPPRPALPVLLAVSVGATPVTPQAPIEPTIPTNGAGMTNVSLDVAPPPRSFSFDDWLSDLEIEADNGRNFPKEWQLRLVELAVGREPADKDLGATLSGETRTLLSTLFSAISAVREVVANPMTSGAAALTQVDALREKLADRADPVVSTVALCQRVVTFGVYEELPAEYLVAGREMPTIVYSEIRNLRSERKEDGRFETRLATRLEVFNASGISVWLKEEPEIVDNCRSRRSDFFVAQRVNLPPTIPAGDYSLKVSVEDRLAGRVSEYILPITMQSAVSVAQGR